MGKLDDFDLDVKVKTEPNGGVVPSIATRYRCTPGCPTGWVFCGRPS